MDSTMIAKAIRMAREKRRICAIITNKRGRIISIGVSSLKTHPKQAKLAKISGERDRIYLHAEIDAITKLRQQMPHTIYVARARWDDYVCGLAAPCRICQIAIKQSGIKRVVYTVNSKTLSYRVDINKKE